METIRELSWYADHGMDLVQGDALSVKCSNGKTLEIKVVALVFQTMGDKDNYIERLGLVEMGYDEKTLGCSAAMFFARGTHDDAEAVFMFVREDLEAMGPGALYHESLHAAMSIVRLANGLPFNSSAGIYVVHGDGSEANSVRIEEETVAELMDSVAKVLRRNTKEKVSWELLG